MGETSVLTILVVAGRRMIMTAHGILVSAGSKFGDDSIIISTALLATVTRVASLLPTTP